jgi:hypothetical protein
MESNETRVIRASRDMYIRIIALAGSTLSAEERTRIVIRFKGNRLEIEGDPVVVQRLLTEFELQPHF